MTRLVEGDDLLMLRDVYRQQVKKLCYAAGRIGRIDVIEFIQHVNTLIGYEDKWPDMREYAVMGWVRFHKTTALPARIIA